MYPVGFLFDWDLIRHRGGDSWLVRRSSIKGAFDRVDDGVSGSIYRGNDFWLTRPMAF